MQYWDTHTNLFSQTSAVQPRWSVSGGLVKSRFPELLLLQLEISIGFTRKDICNLTFREQTRKRAHPDLFLIHPSGAALVGGCAHDVQVNPWIYPDFMEEMRRFHLAIKETNSA